MSTLTLDVESIAAGGDGVARHDGLVVFVPRTAPGDRVTARVDQKGRLGRGTVVTVDHEGADRVVPGCAHYSDDGCGGCQLQHLSWTAQREAKGRIIADAFRRIGKRTIAPPEVRSGEREWRYRSKLTLALRRRGAGWIAGLRAFDDPARVIPLRDCLIADARLVTIWGDLLRVAHLLPDAAELRGAVQLLIDDAGASFTLEGGHAWPRHEEFVALVPALTALWWKPEHGVKQLLQDRRAASREPSSSFAQVNREVAALLSAYLLERVRAHGPRTAIDAYAGRGDVALALAGDGTRVTAIEMDADASRYCASRLPDGSRAICARVEDAISAALPADVVILNPPRTGLDPSVAARLAAGSCRKAIVYVSCDPATLARDVARLSAWRIASLTAFDMFPQTAHVETVCELVPEVTT